jgi:uncharacterized protein (DUF4415 family)
MIAPNKLSPQDIPTKEQLKRIEKAARLPIVPDEDSSVYTAKQLARLYAESKKVNIKQTVRIRLSKKTIEQYKTMGKEYTGIMAAVLDYAIKHPKVVKNAKYKNPQSLFIITIISEFGRIFLR